MTTLELKLSLPNGLAREAQAAGLLTPESMTQLLKDAIRKRAGQTLLAGAARATQSGSKPISLKEIQSEVNSVRRHRKTSSST